MYFLLKCQCVCVCVFVCVCFFSGVKSESVCVRHVDSAAVMDGLCCKTDDSVCLRLLVCVCVCVCVWTQAKLTFIYTATLKEWFKNS